MANMKIGRLQTWRPWYQRRTAQRTTKSFVGWRLAETFNQFNAIELARRLNSVEACEHNATRNPASIGLP
jgi:predicted phosphoadenosine phosphosulfate sulfurtransferase